MGKRPDGRPRAERDALSAAAAHVFVEDLSSPALEDEDAHHLERVLRVRPGQAVTVADGRGGWRQCRWADGAVLVVDGPPSHDPAPAPPVTVGFALTKGERPEWVVQKLTELGVDRIVPFVAARTVVRWEPAKAERQILRLRAVARAAAMQSRRTWLPLVEGVTSFAAAAAALAPSTGALAHPGGGGLDLSRPALLVGPEGGFTDDELGAGLPLVDLGPTVLRAETAAIAAGVLLCALRSGRVGAPSTHARR
jgi:16S rRNA (uracil1498-N3)-methyltransferase